MYNSTDSIAIGSAGSPARRYIACRRYGAVKCNQCETLTESVGEEGSGFIVLTWHLESNIQGMDNAEMPASREV